MVKFKMMWFDVIGNSLAFIGSVIFSADLLKSGEQVQDENATYLDANPYTTKNGLESRPVYVFAFFLIATGFAITLGGNIGEVAGLNLFDSILIALLTALGGCLVIALIYRVNERRHKETKARLKVKIFYSSLKSLTVKYEKYVIGQHNEKVLFATYKPHDLKAVEDKLEDMLTPPEEHMKDIIVALARKRTAKTFNRCIEDYLSEYMV